eukprot:CAMPEP_0180483608 /NCGR_PEP_ID=MMETSP1036_2-20121128/35513_1 /TAXON_ID=632150 /ORGANISM="Azadinium spinosum, Strain 3D9" /LENGTH=313 /DNA_ID=CAMNT_0022491427 /DNA_START=33 /DNA_END=971 /DNA_ORIENTATION=+
MEDCIESFGELRWEACEHHADLAPAPLFDDPDLLHRRLAQLRQSRLALDPVLARVLRKEELQLLGVMGTPSLSIWSHTVLASSNRKGFQNSFFTCIAGFTSGFRGSCTDAGALLSAFGFFPLSMGGAFGRAFGPFLGAGGGGPFLGAGGGDPFLGGGGGKLPLPPFFGAGGGRPFEGADAEAPSKALPLPFISASAAPPLSMLSALLLRLAAMPPPILSGALLSPMSMLSMLLALRRTALRPAVDSSSVLSMLLPLRRAALLPAIGSFSIMSMLLLRRAAVPAAGSFSIMSMLLLRRAAVPAAGSFSIMSMLL